MNKNEVEIRDLSVNDAVYFIFSESKYVIKSISPVSDNVVYYKVSNSLNVRWMNALRFGMFVDKKMSFLCKEIRNIEYSMNKISQYGYYNYMPGRTSTYIPSPIV